MKNYDEFRRTVFEKADRYKAKRKARNQKIIEIVSLCSLCLVLGISAYFALERSYFAPESVDTCLTTPTMETPQAVQTTLADAPVETAGTTTGAYMTTTAMYTTDVSASFSATQVPSPTTTIAMTISTTIATTTEAETMFTQDSTSTNPAPTQEAYTFHDSIPSAEENFNEVDFTPALFAFQDHTSLKEAMESDFANKISQNEQETLLKTYDEAFFENNVLLILHASESHPWDIAYEDGHFTYTVKKAESTENEAHMFLIFSVSKDTFLSATLVTETQ